MSIIRKKIIKYTEIEKNLKKFFYIKIKKKLILLQNYLNEKIKKNYMTEIT